jgi:hypothetical protein
MKKLIFALALFLGSASSAMTDYACVSKCTSDGNTYGLCVNRCSTNDTNQNNQRGNSFKQTDYGCVNKCTRGGTMYSVCVDKCSY